MDYICYIELAGSSVPHMEPLAADNIVGARAEAVRLLQTHASAAGAAVYDGTDLVFIISQDEMAA